MSTPLRVATSFSLRRHPAGAGACPSSGKRGCGRLDPNPAGGGGQRDSEEHLALGASILETGAAMLEASAAILKPGATILSGGSVEELGGGGEEEVST